MFPFYRFTAINTLLLLFFSAFICRAQESPTELIVYTTQRPGNHDIHLLDKRSGKHRQITDHTALDYNATFSPDGEWIVFTSERNGNADLFALKLEGNKKVIQLTKSKAMDDAADISPDGKWLIFVSNRDGFPDIYKMKFAPDQANSIEAPERLTKYPLGDFNPSFSPDGSQIAFSRQQEDITDRHTDIFLMDSDGSNVKRVTDYRELQQISGAPDWSPDGEHIYFYAMQYDRKGYIGRIRADSSKIQKVISDVFVTHPSITPDGRILFYKGPPPPGGDPFLEQGTVYSMDKGGENVTMEVDTALVHPCLAPAFSSNGLIACHGPGKSDELPRMANGRTMYRPGADKVFTHSDIKVRVAGIRGYFPDIFSDKRLIYGEWANDRMDIRNYGYPPIVTSHIDGSDREVVLAQDKLPAWSIDSCSENDLIAFNAGPTFAPPGGSVDIWTMRSDGSHLKNITSDTTSNDAFPAWSPDCKTIAFRSGRDGNKEIYIMDRDGKNLKRLTHEPGIDTAPAFSPNGKWIAFSTDRDGQGITIWIQNLLSGKGRFLEPERVGKAGTDMHPRYSPDGNWIVFVSDRGGNLDEWPLQGNTRPNGDLWIIASDGSGSPIRLTNDKWENGLPKWGKWSDNK